MPPKHLSPLPKKEKNYKFPNQYKNEIDNIVRGSLNKNSSTLNGKLIKKNHGLKVL